MKRIELRRLREALHASGERLGVDLLCDWVSPECDRDLRIELRAVDKAGGNERGRVQYNPASGDRTPWTGNPLSSAIGREWLTPAVDAVLSSLAEQARPLGLIFQTENLRRSTAPLFHRPHTRRQPQPAFVTLDAEGAVTADWSPESGPEDAPEEVNSLLVVRWQADPKLAGPPLDEALRSEPMHSLLTRVHAGHRLVQRDGAQRGELTPDAEKARGEFGAVLRAVTAYPGRLVQVLAVEDFIGRYGLRKLGEIWNDGPLQVAVRYWEGEIASAGARDRMLVIGSVETALLMRALAAWNTNDPALKPVHVEELAAAQLMTRTAADQWLEANRRPPQETLH